MPNVERSVIHPPNQMLQGLARTRSATPAAGAPALHPPNATLHGGDPGSSASMSRSSSPVSTPDNRFHIEDAKMDQPASVTEPGKGSIPIYGFNSSGMPNKAMPGRDSAKSSGTP